MWGRPLNRRTFVVAGAAAAAAMVTGCGSSGSNSSRSSQGDGSGGFGGELSILFLGGSDAVQTYLNDTLLPDFAEANGYEVELQNSDWGSGFQKVVTAAASGTLADVLLIGGIWTAPLASKNALLPLDDFFGDWSEGENFYPGMVDDGRYEDTLYALPLYSDTRTAMYRRDLLEQAGVDPEALPVTWDDFRTVAQEVQAAGIPDLISAVHWGQDTSIGLQQTFAQLMLQAGGTYYDEDGKAQFSGAAGREALEYLTSFYRDGLADVNMVDQGTGANPIVAGQAAMTFSGLPMIRNAQKNAPDVEAALLGGQPLTGPAGEPVTSAWINKLGISARTEDPEGAWSLLQAFVTKPAVVELGGLLGLPTRSDLDDAEYVQSIPPALIDAAQYIVPQPAHPNMLTIAPEIKTFLEQAIRNPGDSESILTDLDAKIDEINGV